jgi:hypothetical protein
VLELLTTALEELEAGREDTAEEETGVVLPTKMSAARKLVSFLRRDEAKEAKRTILSAVLEGPDVMVAGADVVVPGGNVRRVVVGVPARGEPSEEGGKMGVEGSTYSGRFAPVVQLTLAYSPQ